MAKQLRAIAGPLLALSWACAPSEEGPATVSDAATRTVAAVDWAQLDSVMGRTGAVQAGDVHRYGMPRSDLKVTVGNVTLRPAFALGSWIAFKAMPDGAIAMGDLVLTEDELGPVTRALHDGGIDQTAIHHHVIHETPRVLYTHVHARGDPMAIATTVRTALALTGTPGPAPAGAASTIDLDTAAVAAALGYDGRVNGGVLQFGIPRSEAIHSGGMEIPPTMGLGTAINFQPLGGGRAAITGDFVMLASEVNMVIKALANNGIESTSLHNHMLDEEPRLFFMHFWATDDAVTLAKGLHAALALTSSRPPTR